MAVYFVTGQLGNGKGIFSAYRAQQYYRAGRRVAANYPFDTTLLGPRSEAPVFVLPARPRIEDFHLLGRGAPEAEKEKFGALFLDECSSWLNARHFARADRSAIIDWIVHSRKLGWDVYFIVQDEEMVDKQVLNATGEHVVRCSRLDRLRVPLFSTLMELFRPKAYGVTGEKKGILPLYIKARTFIGAAGSRDKPANVELFPAKPYFGLYDTNFVFTDGTESLRGRLVDMRACYSQLPAKYLTAQLPVLSKPSRRGSLKQFAGLCVCLGLLYTGWRLYRSPETPAGASGTVVQIQEHSEGLQAQPVPPDPPLSSVWRLQGYIQRDREQFFILRDSAGHTRLVYAMQPWQGAMTEVVVDGERVTSFSGQSAKPEIKNITEGVFGK
ncbi:hypothetical protein L8Q74_01575 [Enterobacter roggenkampii]|nr:hypothetical protein [Enterobacter roggenkampii]